MELDSVVKKRWMQLLANVQSLELESNRESAQHASVDLGRWIQTQLDHYSLYKEGLPNPLCAKQIELLEEIGLQSLLRLRSIADRQASKGAKGTQEEQPDVEFDGNEGFDETAAKANANDNDESETVAFLAPVGEAETGGSGSNSQSSVAAASPIKRAGVKSEKDTIKHEAITDSSPSKYHVDTDNEEEPAAGITEGKSNAMKGRCDVCRKRDGHQGHNLQQCKECGMKVHELCYGLIGTDTKNPDFVCYACKAVGTRIEVNVPSRVGPISKKNKREFMTQEKRPTECVLCSFDDGSYHAMHPIMDTDGADGRQLVLPKSKHGEKRLAWCHTLCATFICTNKLTAGCVYGLNEDNEFQEGDDAEDEQEEDDTGGSSDEDDMQSDGNNKHEDRPGKTDENSGSATEAESNNEDEDINLSNMCAYAIAGKNYPDYTKVINQNRTNYKCFICGENDAKSLRIPVQCIVDEEHDVAKEPDNPYEYPEFLEWRQNYAKYHSEAEFLEDREAVCTVAMHVGCARWGANLETVADKKISHLVYFYSGQQTGGDGEDLKFTEPVANCYCPAHAREVILGNPKNADKVRHGQMKKAGRKRNASPLPKNRQSPAKRARRNREYEKKKKEARKARKSAKKALKRAKAAESSPKPFGKKKSSVTISEVKEEGFVVLGRAGRALSKQRAGHGADTTINTIPKEAVAVKNEPDSSSATAASKNGQATMSLSTILSKVTSGTNEVAAPPVSILKKTGPGPIATAAPPPIKQESVDEPESNRTTSNHQTISSIQVGSIVPDVPMSSS
jgi:hypothetical protein